MPSLEKKSIFERHFSAFFGCLCAGVLYFALSYMLDPEFSRYHVWDSYTLQALAWRSGHLNLPENYSWLEIATYNDQFFLSFPPTPTIPMLLLTFLFGSQPPSNLVMIIYFLVSYWVAYAIALKFKNSDQESALWAFFLVAGSNFLYVSLFGWVWHMAQALNFMLCLITILCMLSDKRWVQGAGLVCFALAIGCRPLQVVYLPVLLFVLWQKNKRASIGQTIRRILPTLIAPALIAVAYGVLNQARFDNPFEFGHTYLPEFQLEGPQFGLEYVSEHFKNIFTLFPTWVDGQLTFPQWNGFAFYIANPIFILLVIRFIRKPKRHALDWALIITIALHFFVTMLHRTLGGWQFGTRYLIDTLPAVYFLCTRYKQKTTWYEFIIMVFAVLLNVYGAIWFRGTGSWPS